MKRFANFLWGAVLITLGIIVGLNALEITNINIFFSGWWTLLIIIPCFIGLFKYEEKLGNTIGVLVGVILLLVAQDVFSLVLVFKMIIPVLLVIIGMKIILKDVIVDSTMKKIKTINKNELDGYSSAFTTQKIEMDGVDFRGVNLDATFGTILLDLKGAHLSEDRVINATAIFGSVTILVPSNLNIKVRSNSMFGGVNNKVKHGNIENEPTVYINGSGIFGSVDIKPIEDK